MRAIAVNSTAVGLALFAGAAILLGGIILSSLSGQISLALVLSQVAQPVCAMAVGVLMYLALYDRRSESDSNA